MICSSCGTQNQPRRTFCAECDARRAITCPNRGTANTAPAGGWSRSDWALAQLYAQRVGLAVSRG